MGLLGLVYKWLKLREYRNNYTFCRLMASSVEIGEMQGIGQNGELVAERSFLLLGLRNFRLTVVKCEQTTDRAVTIIISSCRYNYNFN